MKKLLLSLSAIAALSTPALADTYKLVSSQSDFEPGAQYLVVCPTKNMAMGAPSTSYYTNVAVEIKNDEIVTDANSTYEVVTIEDSGEKGYYYLHSKNGYVTATAVKKMSATDATAAGSYWSVSIADGGTATVASKTTSYGRIQYNASSPRFVNYATNQTAIQLYKLDVNAVEKDDAGLSFSDTECTIEKGAAFTVPTLDKVTDGALTWTSSNEEVATVSADGTVTPVSSGVTKITVEAAETDKYNGGTASYILFVLDGNSFTAVFSDYGYGNQDKVLSTKIGLATVDFSAGTNTSYDPAYYTTGAGIRIYADNLVTVSVPEGYILKSVEFTPASSYWNLAVATADAELGSLNGYVWTPAEGVETASISFTGTGQSRIQKMTVEWEALKAPVTVPSLEATDKNGVFTFEAEEGVTYTYTLNGSEEQLEVKGNTISVAELAPATLFAILLHADGVAAEAPVYAVTAPVPVLAASVNDGMRMLTCAAGEGVTVYYRVVNKIVAYAAEEWTVLPAAGAEVEEGSQIEVKASALTPAEAAVESEVVSLDIPTGIVSIEAEGAVKVYDLSGRAVSGELQPGIYVVVEGGKSRKVVVR